MRLVPVHNYSSNKVQNAMKRPPDSNFMCAKRSRVHVAHNVTLVCQGGPIIDRIGRGTCGNIEPLVMRD